MSLQIGIIDQAHSRAQQDVLVYANGLNRVFIGNSAPWHGLLAGIPVTNINAALKVLFQQYIAIIKDRCVKMKEGEQWFCPFEWMEQSSSGLVIEKSEGAFQVGTASTDWYLWKTEDGFPGVKIVDSRHRLWVQSDYKIPSARFEKELDASESLVRVIAREDSQWLLENQQLFRIGIIDQIHSRGHRDIFVFDHELKMYYISDSYYWHLLLETKGRDIHETAINDVLRVLFEQYMAAIGIRCAEMKEGEQVLCPFDLSDEYSSGIVIGKGPANFQISLAWTTHDIWDMPDGFPGIKITKSSDVSWISPPMSYP